jgi:capsular exopolysaccharide synthesis family protein
VLKRKEKGLITHRSPSSTVSEQYRTIRTNLYFVSMVDSKQMLLITSPDPGDGKSTTTANLAIAIAQQGKKVLIVDADLRKPTIHSIFKVTNIVGLTDVLTDTASIEEAIIVSDIEGIHLMPSGPIPPNPAELLSSKKMTTWMKKAADRYDFILFDSPPLLAVTDASILANLCDGVLLVLCSGKSQDQKAVNAKRMLDYAKAKWIGVVLNQKIG